MKKRNPLFEHDPETLNEIFETDIFHLFDGIKPQRHGLNRDERTLELINSIKAFITKNHRLPDPAAKDREEHRQAVRFNTLKQKDPEAWQECRALFSETEVPASSAAAELESLKQQVPELETAPQEDKVYHNLEDIYQDDPFGLLNTGTFIPARKKAAKRNASDAEASSSGRWFSLDDKFSVLKPCQDFYRYERFFTEVKQGLERGDLKFAFIKGNTGNIACGDMFVIKGQFTLVAGRRETKGQYRDRSVKVRYRVHQILENGREGWPTEQGLRASFYKNQDKYLAQRVLASTDAGYKLLKRMRDDLKLLDQGSGARAVSGYIYVLHTLSSNPEVKKYAGNGALVKIGYCTTSVAERLFNCELSPTYLFAKVKVVKTYTCHGVDPYKLEQTLHAFLHTHRLNITLTDPRGATYHPEEWFTITAETADEIIRHIISNDLDRYYIDPCQGRLKLKGINSGTPG